MGLKSGAVARQELALEVVPTEPGGFVPRRRRSRRRMRRFVRIWRDGFCEVIEGALEDVGIDAIEDQREALPGLRTDGTDDVGAEVVAEVRVLRGM